MTIIRPCLTHEEAVTRKRALAIHLIKAGMDGIDPTSISETIEGVLLFFNRAISLSEVPLIEAIPLLEASYPLCEKIMFSQKELCIQEEIASILMALYRTSEGRGSSLAKRVKSGIFFGSTWRSANWPFSSTKSSTKEIASRSVV
ncbi:hypothetical protein [Sorlinia euscelidii]|uniref:hypothetical protein n=1 Tax=Sorlinia euscelidii TaxID=3081148 RepID=UPI00374E194C